MSRFLYRVPMFTPKGAFTGYEFLEVGERTIHHFGLRGDPEQCLNIKIGDKWLFENDIVQTPTGRSIIAYCDKCKSFQCIDFKFGCFNCLGDYSWQEFLEEMETGECKILGSTISNPELVNDIEEND